jgi:hypothetical protein
VTLIALPILSVILIATLIGIPFGLLGLISFIALIILSAFTTPIIVGSYIHKLVKKPVGYVVNWKTILLGVVVCTLVTYIPVLGGLAIAITLFITVGAIIKMKWDIIKAWR